jgi:hypothetical protein
MSVAFSRGCAHCAKNKEGIQCLRSFRNVSCCRDLTCRARGKPARGEASWSQSRLPFQGAPGEEGGAREREDRRTQAAHRVATEPEPFTMARSALRFIVVTAT